MASSRPARIVSNAMPFSRSSSRKAAIISAFIVLLPFSSASQSTTVLADAMSACADAQLSAGRRRPRCPRRRPRPARPSMCRRPSTGVVVFDLHRVSRPAARSRAAASATVRSRATTPPARTDPGRTPPRPGAATPSRRARRSCRRRRRRHGRRRPGAPCDRHSRSERDVDELEARALDHGPDERLRFHRPTAPSEEKVGASPPQDTTLLAVRR